jgi:hypothetical protein
LVCFKYWYIYLSPTVSALPEFECEISIDGIDAAGSDDVEVAKDHSSTFYIVQSLPSACSFGWWLMAGADLF